MAFQHAFEAIGTHWQIDVYEELTTEGEKALLEAIQARIAAFDDHYSRFRADSLVTAMAKEAGSYVMPDDFEAMYKFYEELYHATNGLVTPLVGQILDDAGYDAAYSLEQKGALQTPPAWSAVMEYHHPNLIMKQPALLDFGAAGKGYLVDLVAEVIERQGIRAYCIDAGGDILHRGQPLQVGLEHPDNPGQAIGVITLQNQSLCGSAGNRRKWGNMHHIVNPQTLASPKDILAVWVLADSTMLSDGLATCLFFVPAHSLTQFNFEYLIVYADYSMEHSTSLPAELFTIH